MKQAMVFAAGLGTRLRPLTDSMPKALVRVGGQPLLWHVLMKLRAAGYGRIVINVHHFARQIVDYLRQNDNQGLDIAISDESEQLLDTGGGIRKALALFDATRPILIHNVDILSNVDLTLFDGQADAQLLVSERTTKRYLQFDAQRRLIGWKNVETGQVKGREGQPLAFSGIHQISPALFPLLRQQPERFSIIDFYLGACADHRIMAATQTGLRLLDIGKPDALARADDFLHTLV